jgi:2-dehydropantoate 2-reductase
MIEQSQNPRPISPEKPGEIRTGHPLRHAILGAGGVGGLIGACLAHAGGSVTLVVRQEAVAQYPKQLRLESAFGNFTVDVAVAAEVPPVDALWITVKATQLEPALVSLKNPDAVRAIVPLLNGIDHVALLRERYGAGRVIPATIAVETERVGPGHIVHRSPQLQQIGFACQFIDDEPTLMWSKLVFLAPFALTTTAADKTTGEVRADPVWKSQLEACVREACAVAVAEGAKVDPEAILAGMMAMPANMRSSMQKDVAQHKTPEVEAIAGPILRGGQRHGIEVPATKKLVAAVAQRSGYVDQRLA